MAAAVCVAALAVWPGAARPHEGHDHSEAPTVGVALADNPRRLADGSVHLPKRTQRQIGLRTVVVEKSEQARGLPLPGTVVADPNAAGKVQATLAGRLETLPGGLPVVGARVSRGQALAQVRAIVDPLQRAAQASQQAEWSQARELTARRLARLRDLADTVPRKEIDAAESELASLEARLRALAPAAAPLDVLRSPVDGVVASVRVQPGQVVESRELLFEIVDADRLAIEVHAYDPALVAQVGKASVSVAGQAVPLEFVGAGRVLRDQAVPLVFRGAGRRVSALAIGQAVEVSVELQGRRQGVVVPRAALSRNAANERIVWVKSGPERFAPTRVAIEALDAERALVTQGLAGGERVVSAGVELLGQVR